MHDRAKFFERETWTAGVIGLGYVGLPLAVNTVPRGLRAIGFDVAAEVVDRIGAGSSAVEDVDDSTLGDALENGLTVTSDEAVLAEADALFICVPSPLNRHRQPDMRFIEAAAALVSRVVRSGMLVSLESTTYPGDDEEDLLVPAVTEGGLALGEDVFVCFSPERVDPGNLRPLGAIPKVVGGADEASGAVATAAYGRLVDEVHLVSSPRAAEMTKLLENTYRAVNIGLVNEMAQLAHELDIDIWEVVEAAATKPFGFQAFYPGPGVGGHCIPLDPHYLAWRAKEAGFATRFIDLTEQVNTTMPDYVAERVADLLNRRGLPVYGSPLLGVGIAFKPNVADDRESPSVDVLRILAERGAAVSVWDPLVDDERIAAHGFTPVADPSGDYPVAVLLTDHDIIDYQALAGTTVPLVFDARGAFARRGIVADNVVSFVIALVVTTVHRADDPRVRERTVGALAGGFTVRFATREPGPSRQDDHEWVVFRGGRARRWFGALRQMMKRDVAVVSLHDPELIVAGLLARLLRRVPVVVDVHENVPAQIRHKDWVPRLLRRPVASAAHRVLRLAERFCVVTLAEAGYGTLFRREHPVFPNYPDPGSLPDLAADGGYVVYVGDVTVARGAFDMIEALAGSGRPLRVVGRVPDDLAARMLSLADARRVDLALTGPLPHREAMEVVAGASVGVSLLHDLPNYRHSMPTKLVEYLAMGVSVAATDLPGTRDASAGLAAVHLCAPGDPVSAAAAIEDAAAERAVAAAGAAEVREAMTWPAGEVLALYLETAGA